MKNLKDLKFGNLLVKEMYPDRTKEGRVKWICQCICGNEKIITGKYLLNGSTTGCGCTLTRKLRSHKGDKNPNWKGGYLNRGSEAWANQKIAKTNNDSKRFGYSPIKDFTGEDLLKLLNQSEGKCAICNKKEDLSQYGRNHLDHCHETGLVRGFLCGHCNTMIGLAKENIEILQKAIEYLKEFEYQKSISFSQN